LKVFNRSLDIETSEKLQEVNIRDLVEAVLYESGIKEGFVNIFTGHTTAGLHLSNSDVALTMDFHDFLNEIIPNKSSYRHSKGDFGKNADAHFTSIITGSALCLPVSEGKIVFGKWQTLYFSEFDGPRNRKVFVKVVGIE